MSSNVLLRVVLDLSIFYFIYRMISEGGNGIIKYIRLPINLCCRLIVLSVTVSSSLQPSTYQGMDKNISMVDETLRNENVSNEIISSISSSVYDSCRVNIFRLLLAFLILWSIALCVEIAIIVVSLRGTILEDHLRWPAEYLLYIKLGKMPCLKK